MRVARRRDRNLWKILEYFAQKSQNVLPHILQTNIGIWAEMGRYGSVVAQMKTGKSYMAQDHV